MHDIGKLIVPNQLLNKPGRLTEAEFERVKRHEVVSVELLRRIDFLAPVAGDTTTEAATAAVDGTGLIEPAIIHVADAFDAMTSTRSYRRALTQETAFDELRDGVGHAVQRRVRRRPHRGDRASRRALRRRSRGRRARVGGRAARGRHRLGRPRRPHARGAGGRGVRRFGAGRSSSLGGSGARRVGHRDRRPGHARGRRSRVIGGAIAAGELIELRPPLRAAAPDLVRVHGGAGRARRRCRTRRWCSLVARAGHLPRAFRADVGRGAARPLRRAARRRPRRGRRVPRHGRALGAPPTRRRAASRSPPPRSRRSSIAEIARMVRERHAQHPAARPHAPTSRSSPARCSWRSATRASTAAAAWASGDPAVFTIPLLAAWYSYEHLDVIRAHLRPDDPRARRRARARRHGARGPRRARRRRSRSRWAASSASRGTSSTQLETAALLHHLGQVCLDEPEDGRPPEPAAVAQAGAAILRGTPLLAPAGDIIAAESMPYRDKRRRRGRR